MMLSLHLPLGLGDALDDLGMGGVGEESADDETSDNLDSLLNYFFGLE